MMLVVYQQKGNTKLDRDSVDRNEHDESLEKNDFQYDISGRIKSAYNT